MKNNIILMPIGVGLDGLQMQYMVLPVVRAEKPTIPRHYKSSLSASGNTGRRKNKRRINKKRENDGNEEMAL